MHAITTVLHELAYCTSDKHFPQVAQHCLADTDVASAYCHAGSFASATSGAAPLMPSYKAADSMGTLQLRHLKVLPSYYRAAKQLRKLGQPVEFHFTGLLMQVHADHAAQLAAAQTKLQHRHMAELTACQSSMQVDHVAELVAVKTAMTAKHAAQVAAAQTQLQAEHTADLAAAQSMARADHEARLVAAQKQLKADFAVQLAAVQNRLQDAHAAELEAPRHRFEQWRAQIEARYAAEVVKLQNDASAARIEYQASLDDLTTQLNRLEEAVALAAEQVYLVRSCSALAEALPCTSTAENQECQPMRN